MPRLKSYWNAKANAMMTLDQRKATEERYAEWQHDRDISNKTKWNAESVVRARQWAKDHPEEAKKRRKKAAEARRARRMADPEYQAKYKARKKADRALYCERHPRTKRAEQLKTKGWTLERHDAALQEQSNCCAICQEPFTATPNADHRHVDPPTPRGLLCNKCNIGIGLFKDSPERCEAAAAYLRKFLELP
jgi:hypothetical protein